MVSNFLFIVFPFFSLDFQQFIHTDLKSGKISSWGGTSAKWNNYLRCLPPSSLAVHSKIALGSNGIASHCVQDHNDPLVLLSILLYTYLLTILVSHIYFILSEYRTSPLSLEDSLALKLLPPFIKVILKSNTPPPIPWINTNTTVNL